MKRKRQTATIIRHITAVLVIIVILSSAISTTALDTTYSHECITSEELVSYVLEQLGNREPNFTVTIPDSLPEASLSNSELFWDILRQDNGFIRWGYKGGIVRIMKSPGYISYEYNIEYYATKEEDDFSRSFATDIVAEWNIEELTDFEKIEMLAGYITENWRYDESLESMTAYTTMTTGEGTCLGQVMASMLILDNLGLRSQTIHGMFTGIDGTHIMLLVELGDWWYTFDPSDLSRETPSYASYLKSSYRAMFTPKPEYLTEAFLTIHPMDNG